MSRELVSELGDGGRSRELSDCFFEGYDSVQAYR